VEGTLDIEFNYVHDIERTERGKHKFLIQKLPVKFGLDSFRGGSSKS